MRIDVYHTMLTPLNEDVTFRVMVPSGYEDSDHQYPVLYMQDGQFLFYKEDSITADSIGYAEYYTRFLRFLPQVIIVGIDAPTDNPTRTRLYTPFTKNFAVPEGKYFESRIEGLGKEYLDWLVGELKPWIDRNYRTRPQGKYTALGGYSTGAVLSAYGVLTYPHMFSRFIALSGAFYIWMDKMDKVLDNTNTDHIRYIYLDVSDQEEGRMTTSEQYIEGAHIMYDRLSAFGFQNDQLLFRELGGLDHTPNSLSYRFPDAVRWAFQDMNDKRL